MTNTDKPLIAVTMGDPSGIGPEIVVKALCDESVLMNSRCVVAGDSQVLAEAVKLADLPVQLYEVSEPSEGVFERGIINVINIPVLNAESFEKGVVSAASGKAGVAYVRKAAELAMEHKVSAVATAPINKESVRAAGIPIIGHTELFAEITGVKDPLTLFEVRGMRVFFLTRHVSLAQVPGLITRELIVDYVERCKAALNQLGVKDGVMAVAGLNPHSGEHGLFGMEEVEQIAPAVSELQQRGIQITGPISADSVFHQALQGRFNSVLSLYHDQGHIATKMVDFERTVSITCGMPVLRTSVDHGTAFDIAWKNQASAVSMIEAINVACKYVQSGNFS